jgi:hypothetical protein
VPCLRAVAPVFRSSPKTPVLARLQIIGNMNASVVFGHALLHRHSVATVRHHRPGEDAHAFAFADWAEIGLASVAGADALHCGGANVSVDGLWMNKR